MRLREAFSSFVSSCHFPREAQPQSRGFSSTLSKFMPPSKKTDADGLVVAVVLTLELAKIARALVRFDHIASNIKSADHSIM
jgi:hypothetical protein